MPFTALEGSFLCPVTALRNLLCVCPADNKMPLFSYRVGAKNVSWTHDTFVKKLRSILQELGIEPRSYSGHSFRRGGASLGFRLGMSIIDIKSRGDWKSAAVERYIFIDDSCYTRVADTLVRGATQLAYR